MRPPRRVSGPVGGRAAAAAAPRESFALGERALALVRGLPDHSLIDRLVRGRAWIPVLGVLLAGIVAMQVEILKLGASTGRALEQTSTLQTRNQALQANVATLADDQRIERIAASQGMVMPSPDSLVFLAERPGGEIGRALGNIQPPDASAFSSALAAQAAAAAALMPATSTTSSTSSAGASTGAVSSTSGTSAPTSTIPATSPAAGTSQTTSGASVAPTAPAAGSATSAVPSSGAASGTAAGPSTGTQGATATGTAGAAALAPSQSNGG